MAISAQELNIILSARDKEFARAMAANQRRVERFARQSQKELTAASKSFDMLGTAAKRLAPLIAGVVTVRTIQNMIDGAVEIGNLARVAGVGAERFQELAFAGNAFGVGQEKMADILKDVNDKFGDYMQTGAGPLADFFENIAPKVGLTASAFADLSSDQKLGAYVKALEAANLSQADMTFYMEAIASDSTLLIDAFRNNGSELDRLSDKIRNAGGIMSAELVERAKDAKEEFNLAAQVIEAQFSVALQDLLPLLRDGATFVASLATNIAEAYLAIKDFFGEVTTNDAEKRLESIDEKIRKITESGLRQADKENRINELLIDRARIMDRINQLRAKENEEARKLSLSEPPALPDRRTMTPIGDAPTAKKRKAKAKRDGIPATREQIRGLTDDTRELERVLESASLRMVDSFFSIAAGAQTAEEAFKNLAMTALQSLTQIALQDIMRTGGGGLFGQLGSFLAGALPATFGGTASNWGGAKALAAGVPAAQSLGIGGAAQGGTLSAGQPAIVGESGRELFVPAVAGRILSVPQTKEALGAGGGVTVQQTINVTTGVQQTVRAEIQTLMPQIAAASTQAVLDARKRGGAFAGAFR